MYCFMISLDFSMISIHAPLAGGDGYILQSWFPRTDFNPRPPRGGRLPVELVSVVIRYFNPRPPRGGRRANL